MENGICFAGGGIKCAAHIGAIKAMEEKNIKFKYVAGASSGSIISVLYALGYTTDEMYEIIKKYSKEIKYVEYKNLFKLIYEIICLKKIKVSGLNSGKKLEKLVKEICNIKGINNINQIKKYIFIPTVDLNTGNVYIFSSKNMRKMSNEIIYLNDGEISKIVRASCSFPRSFLAV